MARKHIDRLGREFAGEAVGPASKLAFDNSTNGFAATNVQAAIEEVEAAIPAPAPAGSVTLTRVGAIAGSTTFVGAPASLPKNVKLYAFGHETYGAMILEVIEDAVTVQLGTINFGRPVVVSAGISRINGGLQFDATITLDGTPGVNNPFLGYSVSAVATF